MSNAEAIELALKVYQRPARARSLRRQDFPAGILSLIKIAASTEDEVEPLIGDRAAPDLPVRDAAVFYLQQILMHAGNDDYRQLGLKRGASLQDLKDHKRLLLKWLHPDRNRNAWENVLFQRVAAAAKRLEAAMQQGAAMPVQFTRPKSSRRRRRPSGWRISQKRVKQPVDWRPRLRKVMLAIAAFVAVVGTAEAILLFSSGSGLKPSMASFVNNE
jgi:hypothetical protein